MNDKTIFNIHEQHAQNIYNIARDMNVTQNSPPEDMLKLIQAIQQKVGELDIGDKDKKEITKQLGSAKVELDSENPDKGSIGESIKKINGILKEAKATGETLKDIGLMVGKAAVWLGTTAASLGWIF